MSINRREFVVLSAAVCAGCSGEKPAERNAVGEEAPSAVAGPGGNIDAGPVADYSTDGVYIQYRDHGFFVVRRGDRLFAISSYCTHRRCKLAAEPDHSFYCKCHGSTFDPNGKVTDGPATKDLPVFTGSQDERGHLLVKMSGA